ncbi:GGDEF domain-containing protein [Salinisphaera sp. SPP-AMP-43]|uniref:GGDEF domain-containing protein n=1 Tax=Salinisphaera sp. SPP-AMP-43 TaxID=3121288 RepID=UPI003C6E89FA
MRWTQRLFEKLRQWSQRYEERDARRIAYETSALAPAGEAERRYRFWMGMLYAALGGYALGSAAIFSYIALTWSQSNRVAMVGVISAALLTAITVFIRRRRLVRSPHRGRLFAACDAATFALIVVLCVLDSGINSPMTYLYILPMLYLGIGFSLEAVLASGFIGLLGCVLLIMLNTGPVYGPTNMLQLMTLSVGWVLAILGALNRERQDNLLMELRLRLEKLATTDELTGCLNQRAFMAAVEQEYSRARRYSHDMALLLIDIDYFKQINDQHGHLMGDAVLRYVGEMMHETARHADIVGRQGGDEMALLAPETGVHDARVLAERLVQQIRAHTFPVDLTLSIGVCAMNGRTDDVQSLFQRADQALYDAKRRGRDQVAICREARSAGAEHSKQDPLADPAAGSAYSHGADPA